VTILDTGPLVAFLDKNDPHHAWAKREMDLRPVPFLTCEAVLSEACFLLEAYGGQIGVMDMVSRGSLKPSFVLAQNTEAVKSLMTKYADLPMSLADACLVRMTEIADDPIVMTTDSHLGIYRRFGRQPIKTLLPG